MQDPGARASNAGEFLWDEPDRRHVWNMDSFDGSTAPASQLHRAFFPGGQHYWPPEGAHFHPRSQSLVMRLDLHGMTGGDDRRD